MRTASVILPAFLVAVVVIGAVVFAWDPQALAHLSSWMQGVVDGLSQLEDALRGRS